MKTNRNLFSVFATIVLLAFLSACQEMPTSSLDSVKGSEKVVLNVNEDIDITATVQVSVPGDGHWEFLASPFHEGKAKKGTCGTPEELGLWYNPQGHPTAQYHPFCSDYIADDPLELTILFEEGVNFKIAGATGNFTLKFLGYPDPKPQIQYTQSGTTTGSGTITSSYPVGEWTINLGHYYPATGNDMLDGTVDVLACNVANPAWCVPGTMSGWGPYIP